MNRMLLALDILCLLIAGFQGFICYYAFNVGNELLFIFAGAACVFALRQSMRFLDWLLTGFCMWWLKRKAMQSMKFLREMAEKDRSDV